MSILIKTVGTSSRDYSTIQAFEDDLDDGTNAANDATAYSSGDTAQAELYKDSTFSLTSQVTVNGGTTVGLSKIVIRAADGQGHTGKEDTGVFIYVTDSIGVGYRAIYNSGATITQEWGEGLEFEAQTSSRYGMGLLTSSTTGTAHMMRGAICHNTTRLTDVGAATNNIVNCIGYDTGGNGDGSANHSLYNCTVVKASADANNSITGFRHCLAVNCICMHYGGISGHKDFLDQNASNEYLISSDASADDTDSVNSHISKTAAETFISVTAGSWDLHLVDTDSPAYDTGKDLVDTPTNVKYDIDNRDRDAEGDTWDIGADEYVAGAEHTAAYTALSYVLTVPSVTATAGHTAAYTALSYVLTTPSNTPTYEEEVDLYYKIIALSNLKVYYPLDEASGNARNRAPATLGSHDGAVSGCTTGQTGWVGDAYSFDGDNDEITVPYHDDIDVTTDDISIFALIKPASLPSGDGDQMQIVKHLRTTPTAGGYQMELNGTDSNYPNQIRLNLKGPDDNYLSGDGVTLEAGKWYFVVVTYDGSNMKSYVNTVNDKTDTSTGNIDTNPQDMIIGGQADSDNNFDGLIQHVGLVERAITQAEIDEMFGTMPVLYDAVSITFTVPSTTATYEEEPTAAYTALSYLLTIPSTAATYESEQTSAYTALSYVFTIPSTTASYEDEDTVAYTALSYLLTVPSTTATYEGDNTASYTALSYVFTIPSTTAAFEDEDTASYTALSYVFTVPSTTATHEVEKSATYTSLSVMFTVPSVTATFSSGETASYTPLSVLFTLPATTSTYESEQDATITALSVVFTIPSVTATYSGAGVAAYTALSYVFTVPANTATYEGDYTSAYTALSYLFTIPSTTSTYESEQSSAYTALSYLFTVPSNTASYDEDDTSAFSPISLVIGVPSNTATYKSVLTSNYGPVSVVFTNPSMTATSDVTVTRRSHLTLLNVS